MFHMINSIVGFVFMIIPLVLMAFVLRWIRFIYVNTDKQTKQNEEIIALLKEIKKQNEK